jgi:hypothetical protein
MEMAVVAMAGAAKAVTLAAAADRQPCTRRGRSHSCLSIERSLTAFRCSR